MWRAFPNPGRGRGSKLPQSEDARHRKATRAEDDRSTERASEAQLGGARGTSQCSDSRRRARASRKPTLQTAMPHWTNAPAQERESREDLSIAAPVRYAAVSSSTGLRPQGQRDPCRHARTVPETIWSREIPPESVRFAMNCHIALGFSRCGSLILARSRSGEDGGHDDAPPQPEPRQTGGAQPRSPAAEPALRKDTHHRHCRPAVAPRQAVTLHRDRYKRHVRETMAAHPTVGQAHACVACCADVTSRA